MKGDDRATGLLTGILNVKKPLKMTSHDVVDVVRRAAKTRKVGHAGTLDPAADGVLLVCIGAATRVSDHLMSGTKQYRATVQFGASSTTDDSEGTITPSGEPVRISEHDILAALPRFLGNIDQIPPAYAAIKVGGKPMYESARAGQVVVVPPRQVRIDDIVIRSFHETIAVLDVTCSKGTYIRALARDLGEQLGTTAYLAGLTRTRSGAFRVEDSVDLDSIRRAGRDGYLDRLLYPLDAAVADWPAVILNAADVVTVLHGGRLNGPPNLVGPRVRSYDVTGRLIAFLELTGPDASWRPTAVFAKDQLDDVA